MLDIDELENRIQYHKPNEIGIQTIADMRRYAYNWVLAIRQEVPEGREQALAFTKIEEALMWAIAGIAREDEIQLEHSDDWKLLVGIVDTRELAEEIAAAWNNRKR